jgi:hypothetical protein
MPALITLCTRLGFALLALFLVTAIYSVTTGTAGAWTVSGYFLIPGLILVLAERILERPQRVGATP